MMALEEERNEKEKAKEKKQIIQKPKVYTGGGGTLCPGSPTQKGAPKQQKSLKFLHTKIG
jgi:hypothetical protein